MTKRELRRFRKAGGRAMRKARRKGELSKADQKTILVRMLDDEQVELMAETCKAQAVKCGLITAERAARGDIKWVGLFENVDWAKFAEFFMSILPLFL